MLAHLKTMLRLVESLAAKTERAKRTTVEYLSLLGDASHHCAWCGQYAKGSPKSWQCYGALDRAIPGGDKAAGEVCGNPECRVSVGPSTLSRDSRHIGRLRRRKRSVRDVERASIIRLRTDLDSV
jgi:hypothetical protein